MVHFVGAGSGAPDLITLRGKKFLEEADVVIYAGSLVNPQLLEYTKENCEIYNSAKMTLEEVLDVIFAAEEKAIEPFLKTMFVEQAEDLAQRIKTEFDQLKKER